MVKAKYKRRREKRHWHHRVPDFKLVYCGPQLIQRKEEKTANKNTLVSVKADGNEKIDE